MSECPECKEDNCPWNLFAEQESEYKRMLPEYAVESFEDIDPTLQAYIVCLYTQQAEQIAYHHKRLEEEKGFYHDLSLVITEQAEQLQETRNTLKRAFKKFCLDDDSIGSQEITSEIIKVLPTEMLDGEGLDDNENLEFDWRNYD